MASLFRQERHPAGVVPLGAEIAGRASCSLQDQSYVVRKATYLVALTHVLHVFAPDIQLCLFTRPGCAVGLLVLGMLITLRGCTWYSATALAPTQLYNTLSWCTESRGVGILQRCQQSKRPQHNPTAHNLPPQTQWMMPRLDMSCPHLSRLQSLWAEAPVALSWCACLTTLRNCMQCTFAYVTAEKADT